MNHNLKQQTSSISYVIVSIFVILCVLNILSSPVHAQPPPALPITPAKATATSGAIGSTAIKELKGDWQYRLGDSPVSIDTSMPTWLSSESNSSDWKPFSYPGNPPGYEKHKVLWLRIKLPSKPVTKPTCLFFSTHDRELELYLNKKLIYWYGKMETFSDSIERGTSWHMVKLPADSPDQFLYIRIYSPFAMYIGHTFKMYTGPESASLTFKADMLLDTVRYEIDYIIFACMFIFLGFGMIFIFFLRGKQQKEFLSLGFSSICVGLWLLGDCNLTLLFLDSRIITSYIAVLAIQLAPIGFCAFVENIFNEEYRAIPRRLKYVFIAYDIISFLLDITGLMPFTYTLGIFHILLVACMVIIVAIIIKAAVEGNPEAKIISLGVAFVSVAGIYDIIDMFYINGFIPWLKGHHITHWGMFGFLLSLVLIVGKRFMEVYDRMRTYSSEIEIKNKTLNQMWKEVKHSRDKLAEWNKTLERTVKQKTAAIKRILNNAGQGFLTFGEDLLIDEEYSLECIKIFKSRIENKKFSDLIYPDGEQKKYLDLMLTKILKEANRAKRDLYIPLLPDEIVVNDRYINIEYKIIDSPHRNSSKLFMAILTDITAKRFLENKMEQERNVLKMVVKAVTNYNDLIKCMKDYQNFCENRIFEILSSPLPLKDISFEIFRLIHTYKGSFSQLDLVNVVDKLHDFESKISELNKNIDNITLDGFKEFISGFDMYGWLQEDINVLKETLGEHFFDQEKALFVDQIKLVEIEKKMLAVLGPEQSKLLLPELRKLRYKPFKELLKSYPKFVEKLSERLEKLANPLIIRGGDILVDTERYEDFAVSLMHVFRNAMDHGLETPEERVENGKEEYGNIECSLSLVDNNICLVIADDGCGIDLEKIRRKAVEYKIYDSDTVNKLSDDQLTSLIFMDGFSTKDVVTKLAGRGVGLSAVKHEVTKLNGTIDVKTSPGNGTEFRFILPYEEM